MLNEMRLLDEFMQLVQISSPTLQERQMADCLKDKLVDLGFTVTEDDAAKQLNGSSGNLIARLPGDGPNVVMLCAHMDTVQPGVGVIPVREGEVIRSKGDTVLGGDDKAGVCAILETLRVIKENNLPHPGLVVVFTVAEEGGLRGAKALNIPSLGADFGFCLDAGGPVGAIIQKAPAQVQIHAVIQGQAAHAGICPEQGISAIQVAAEAVMRMKLGRVDADSTANIGVINGGKATNIIPASVELDGEARSLIESKLSQQTTDMVETLKRVAQNKGAKAEVEVIPTYPAMFLSKDSKVMQIAVQAARDIGLTPKLIATGGGSDANIFNGAGLPTANLAIGMEKVHSTDEFIRVKDLIDMMRFLLAIVQRSLV